MSARPLTILVGVDGSLHAARAVRYAVRLCEEAGPRSLIRLCHVAAPAQAARGNALPAASPALEDGFLLAAQGEARAAGCEASVELLHGEAAKVLVQRARSSDADLLVVGHARRKPVVDAVRGTVDAFALAACPCPVVLVP